ncbi:deoxyhypusine monooxygenase [Angomonas deanei]|uniref:Deoxyhypusine hydroxylase n=1 Tax=Angomonas deanei TaxID=59799 RepID=A0A7G2CPI7_9TRYP|nr:deoxyhypusine monooxygenase [Angomonas deanei]CAD2221269.1 PBS lyase HEAT-like repeat/HEAT repeats, putative [Angomonas deanei]|eukprot:EPY38165.1 deoxyhypusine monooxygenase [Angomonas deanei]
MSLEETYAVLLDPAAPLDARLRDLYKLKESALKTEEGVSILIKCIDRTDSVLLQHEVVYNIGQSGQLCAIPALEKVLKNEKVNDDGKPVQYDTVTRHEAAEALGAIGGANARTTLEYYYKEENESEAAIRESCALALARIYMEVEKGKEALQIPNNCPYVSVDPTPAFNEKTVKVADLSDLQTAHHLSSTNSTHAIPAVPTTVSELETILLDTENQYSIIQRYMAMFTLRNIATKEAVAVLCRALRQDTRSALFRHEVAFVLGQLEHKSSEAALVECLRDEKEHAMVRHEAAEALGAIAEDSSLAVLQEYAAHPEPIVRDSCIVALEMHKYWSNFNQTAIASKE